MGEIILIIKTFQYMTFFQTEKRTVQKILHPRSVSQYLAVM